MGGAPKSGGTVAYGNKNPGTQQMYYAEEERDEESEQSQNRMGRRF